MEEFDLRLVGQRIREARTIAKLSQQELGDLLGAPQTWISAVETGKQRGLEARTIFRIGRVLDVSADYLLGLTNNPATRARPRRQPAADTDTEEPAA